MGKEAQKAAKVFATLLSSKKDAALLAIADQILQNTAVIIEANQKDLLAAKENNMSAAMQDRLILNPHRIDDMASAVRHVASLPDPINLVLEGSTRPNGLEIVKKTVPLGVVGMIYESRPNVTVDCAALCLKSGNAVILRGGSEAIHSNVALANIIRSTLTEENLPADAVQLIEDTGRETATHLMQLNGYIDVLIPRGGQGLIQSVVKNATVPVIETGAGLCHIYVDESGDFDMAARILENAKTSRPSVCNAVETLLVHETIAKEFLPLVEEILRPHQVELRGCERTVSILPACGTATDEDWATEYDDYILAIRVVDSIQQAVEHIDHYSTHHSEAIITSSLDAANHFSQVVDSAAVYVNASTRFTDGGEFGLGAEIGIATQKLHVRGPMGLSALTSTKYIVTGNGQIR